MLNIEELTPVSILLRLIEQSESKLIQWLNRIPNERLIEIYGYLNKGILGLERDRDKYEEYDYYGEPYYAKRPDYCEEYQYGVLYRTISKQIEKVHNLRIVKDVKGHFFVPNKIRILTQKITAPEEYNLVDKSLIAKQDALSFLKNIGVKEFTEKELEKYMYDKETRQFVSRMNSINASDDPLEIARIVLHFFGTHKTDEVDFNGTKYVWAINENGTLTFESPRNCCLDLPYIEATGFKYANKVHHKKMISDIYLELEVNELQEWIELLKTQGILYKIKISMQSYGTGYTTGFHYDYSIENLTQYFNLKNVALNKFIWNSLIKQGGWNYSYADETRRLNRNYPVKREESTVLKILKYTEWIEDKHGNLKRPSKVSESTISETWIVNEANGFLKAICFGEEQKKIEAEEQKKEELKKLQQENEYNAVITLGFDSAEDVIEAKECLKAIAELTEYGIDIHELLNTKRKEKSEKNIRCHNSFKNLNKTSSVQMIY